MPGELDSIYIRARHVLLDALEALKEHQDAVILVGAQAIYLHTGDAELSVAPYTTDGDIALDPTVLKPDPKIDVVMQLAGFAHSSQPGTWVTARWNISIDLLVPEALGGAGRRAARLGVHGDRIARKGRGLEAAVIDKSRRSIRSLEEGDPRVIEVAVAGPTALLVAKLHKLADRQGDAGRLADKDALDVYRLLQAVRISEFATGFQLLLTTQLSAAVTEEAVEQLRDLFGSTDSAGSQMAARAVVPIEDPITISASCAILAGDLLVMIERLKSA